MKNDVRQAPDRVAVRSITAAVVVSLIIFVVAVFVPRAISGAPTRNTSTFIWESVSESESPTQMSLVEQTPTPESARGLQRRAAQLRILEGRTDADAGLGMVRIPIESAMQMVEESP